ncbi:pyrophosphatase PpaX [Sporosarcina sp. HYO08]|uniref:pyrophosphatase PpaX n=1 Tax=Sporosarcina sp. HYO08 TaxID=1759557 RepID=UPI000794D25A|nr:pyrophosphatase PpaX [Sporosarcina sp. HYO08]KXH79333.1 pyrophosphatase [Sporosarcina sp. HYO08]
MDKQITALLFDFDGTLADTNELILQSFEYVLNKYFPGQYADRQSILPFLGPTLNESFGELDPEKEELLVEEYRAWNLEMHDQLVAEYDQVTETIKQLKAKGLKLAIVSSKRTDMIEKGIRLLKLEGLFEVIIGQDSVTNPKPNAEPILLALQKLNVSKDEALMIGDNYHDIVGGQNAGVRTAGVAWALKGEAYLQSFEPDYMLGHITDLLAIVDGENQ